METSYKRPRTTTFPAFPDRVETDPHPAQKCLLLFLFFLKSTESNLNFSFPTPHPCYFSDLEKEKSNRGIGAEMGSDEYLAKTVGIVVKMEKFRDTS